MEKEKFCETYLNSVQQLEIQYFSTHKHLKIPKNNQFLVLV